MKITNYQIDALWAALTVLGQEPSMPLNVSFQFVKVKQQLKPFFEALEEIKQQAAKKHADQNGKIPAGSESFRQYVEEIQPVFAEEQEVPLATISQKEFLSLEISISPANLEALMIVLEDEEEQNKKEKK